MDVDSQGGGRKLCSVCDADLSGRKRVKDARGNYFCEVCWTRTATTRSAGADAPDSARRRLADAWTACADRDRNISFEYPTSWYLADPAEVAHASGARVLMSPRGDSEQQAMVVVDLVRVPPGMTLEEVADRHAYAQQSRRHFTERSRASGHHPSGTAAVTLSLDFEYSGMRLRKEVLVLRASSDTVVLVTASCEQAQRLNYRDAFRGILRSVRVTDARLPVGYGVGPVPLPICTLAPAGSEQMQWLWTLFDTTARALAHSVVNLGRGRFRLELGEAAAFEVRGYLLFELMATMLAVSYAPRRRVSDFFYRALTGEPYNDQPSGGLVLLLNERCMLYGHAGRELISPGRSAALTELLSTSGRDDVPRHMDAGPVVAAAQRRGEWHDAVTAADFSTTEMYRLVIGQLFQNSADIEALSIAAMDGLVQSVVSRKAVR